MILRILRSNNPKSKPVAGEAQCKYCRAKSVCGAFTQFSQPPILKTAESELPAAVQALDGDTLGKLLGRIRMADDLVEREIRVRLAEGREVPGWQLKPGSPREKITNPLEVWNAVSKFGVTQDLFLTAVSVTKNGLKSVLRDTTKMKGSALDQIVGECCNGNTTTETTAPRLEQV
jgi:hypothetical protein